MKIRIGQMTPRTMGYFVKKSAAVVKGKINKNGVRAYWWNAVPNAGDLITPALLQYYELTPIHTWKDYAEVLASGSILQNLSDDFSGTVIGSGILNASKPVKVDRATILALRGELTRDHIGAAKDTPLGDPGLIADKLLPDRQEKEYIAGIVPHHSHKKSQKIQELAERYPNDLLVIDIQQDPTKVLAQIDQCEVILSSALHGLVFADALGIPCTWIVLDDPLLPSLAFKYLDYNSALNREQTPILLRGRDNLDHLIHQANHPPESVLESVKMQLDSIFRQFSAAVRAKYDR
jgi:pyruvyltransferase